MRVALGTAFQDNSNTLALLDGFIMSRGKRVTSLTDVVQVYTNGKKVMAVTRAGALYRFRFHDYRDNEPYTPEIRMLHDDIPVESVAMGSEHFVVLFANGNVGGAGLNHDGCLGVEPATPVQTFNRIVYCGGGSLAKGAAASVAAGHNSTGVIDVHGILHVRGYNGYGQLGLGHDDHVHSLQRVNVKSVVVYATGRHSLLVTKKGELWAAGKNTCGQLGLGHRDDLGNFTLVRGGVASAAVGPRHSVIVLKNGEVRECGHMQDSIFDPVERFEQTVGLPPMAGVVVGVGRCAGIALDGRVFSWGPYASGFDADPLPALPHDLDLPPTMMLAGISLAERTRPLAPTHVLAFAMGLHARLGAASAHHGLSDDAVRRIVETCAHVESASERAERGC